MFKKKQIGQCGWSGGSKEDKIRDKIKEMLGPHYVGPYSALWECWLLLLIKWNAMPVEGFEQDVT